jgi:hypothetical protein
MVVVVKVWEKVHAVEVEVEVEVEWMDDVSTGEPLLSAR